MSSKAFNCKCIVFETCKNFRQVSYWHVDAIWWNWKLKLMVFVFDNVVINPWTMLYYRLFKCFVIYLFAIDVNFYICHIFVCLSLRSKCTVYCGIKHIVFFIRMSCRINCIFCLLLIYNFLQVFRIILSRNYSQKKYTRKMFQFQIYLYIKSHGLYWY